MTTQNNLCQHCNGTGTCQSDDSLYSCAECRDFYHEQLGGQGNLQIVPCSHCRGTGRAEGDDGFLLCKHCEGGGFCQPHGEQVGCDFCLETYAANHPEQNLHDPLIQVVCAVCGGKGYMKVPPHLVREAGPVNRPPLGMFRIVMAFIITFVIAMIGSVFVVWAVQAEAKNRIRHGNMEEALRFDSYIKVHKDRTMTVEEIVIFKSIYRTEFLVKRVYPALKESLFARTKPDMHLEEVYFDGESMKFKSRLLGKTFIIEAPRKTIMPGIHTYAFVYKLRLPDPQGHGESVFKWAVTGGQWGFPAKQTTIAVALPPGIDKQSVEIDGGVGPVFWFKRECLSTIDDSGNITFNAGQPMTKLDRFNVKVTW